MRWNKRNMRRIKLQNAHENQKYRLVWATIDGVPERKKTKAGRLKLEVQPIESIHGKGISRIYWAKLQ